MAVGCSLATGAAGGLAAGRGPTGGPAATGGLHLTVRDEVGTIKEDALHPRELLGGLDPLLVQPGDA